MAASRCTTSPSSSRTESPSTAEAMAESTSGWARVITGWPLASRLWWIAPSGPGTGIGPPRSVPATTVSAPTPASLIAFTAASTLPWRFSPSVTITTTRPSPSGGNSSRAAATARSRSDPGRPTMPG